MRVRRLDVAPDWLWLRDAPVRFGETAADARIEPTVRERRNVSDDV